MWAATNYETAAPRVGAGIEVLSYLYPVEQAGRVASALDALTHGGALPARWRVERSGRDIYVEWGCSSHGVRPYFVFLRIK